ncbi:MAG TPA: hypothetical protein DDZ81_10115 [Acetobacteraceae bacterium]|nr:hypothetical protein [Acetobacteraceae bacterium]
MCLWLAGDNVPDFMYPKQSGIVIKIDREPKNNGIAIDFHLTGAGLRNWKRGQYYQHMMKLYAATRRMAKTTIVVMRIHSPTGWGMVYDEVRNEFYKIGEPGSDREAYMLGYDIGMPILWGKKDKLKEFRQHIASASEELSQLPEYEQQQIRAELSARKVPMREQILHTNISKLT